MSYSKVIVGVLRGGPSSEYDISLKTGQNILKNLPEKYQPIDILISKNGEWHTQGIAKSPERILKMVDVVFNGLHGEYGEDGKVQQILDLFNVPYTGSGALSSAMAMNKFLAKKNLEGKGIKMAYHDLLSKDNFTPKKLLAIYHKISPPYIVKPVALGSSVGIYVAKNFPALEEAVQSALTHSSQVLVEEFIQGKEATVGVIDNFRGQKTYSLLPIEIRAPKTSPFFDYNAKYSGISEEICPGNFSQKEKEQLEELALQVHELLGLRHYSRSDFIISPRRGIYFLEANTLPGLTNESLLPKALHAVGMPFPNFLDHILGLALEGNSR